MKRNQNLLAGILWAVVACLDVFNITFDICTKTGSVFMYIAMATGLVLATGLSVHYFHKATKTKAIEE